MFCNLENINYWILFHTKQNKDMKNDHVQLKGFLIQHLSSGIIQK